MFLVTVCLSHLFIWITTYISSKHQNEVVQIWLLKRPKSQKNIYCFFDFVRHLSPTQINHISIQISTSTWLNYIIQNMLVDHNCAWVNLMMMIINPGQEERREGGSVEALTHSDNTLPAQVWLMLLYCVSLNGVVFLQLRSVFQPPLQELSFD